MRAGDRVLVGDRMIVVSESLAAEFGDGDRLVASGDGTTLLRIPLAIAELVSNAVDSAVGAFAALRSASDDQISDFFDRAARAVADDTTMEPVLRANTADVDRALSLGRSTTRLELNDVMRSAMIEGLAMWRDLPVTVEQHLSTVEHRGWQVEEWRAPLGVIGFVFEGRPNVLVDATGVLRSGNVAVYRIGSDALQTARELMVRVISPALLGAGLPESVVSLIDSGEHAAGWALFGDRRLSLAVARGSGAAVADLGAIAKRNGVPVSLHGTGGAWMIVDEVGESRLGAAVEHSLDRKVCNTLNTVCVVADAAPRLIPVVAAAAARAAATRGQRARVNVVGRAAEHTNTETVDVVAIDVEDLGREFEWENAPEFALVIVDSVTEAVELCNKHSPRFVVSVLSDRADLVETVWRTVDAPFVGDGFTRWVDGQFALGRPELGLSNWQFGRLFGRGGILSGDSAYTLRLRVRQSDPELRR